jgi:hypothetical protein
MSLQLHVPAAPILDPPLNSGGSMLAVIAATDLVACCVAAWHQVVKDHSPPTLKLNVMTYQQHNKYATFVVFDIFWNGEGVGP